MRLDVDAEGLDVKKFLLNLQILWNPSLLVAVLKKQNLITFNNSIDWNRYKNISGQI